MKRTDNKSWFSPWLAILLALFAVGMFLALTGCQTKAERAEDELNAVEIGARVAEAKAELTRQHAKDLDKLTVHDKLELGAEKLAAKLEHALLVLGITFAACIAAGIFLGEFIPSLAKRCFQGAAVAGILIIAVVCAYFLLPFVVEYIGWAALALPLIGVAVVVYEIRTHPGILASLEQRAGAVFSKTVGTPPVEVKPGNPATSGSGVDAITPPGAV